MKVHFFKLNSSKMWSKKGGKLMFFCRNKWLSFTGNFQEKYFLILLLLSPEKKA